MCIEAHTKHIHTNTRTHTYKIHTCLHTHKYMCMHTQAPTKTLTPTQIPMYTQLQKTNTHAHSYTQKRPHKCMSPAHTHRPNTHRHTHTHSSRAGAPSGSWAGSLWDRTGTGRVSVCSRLGRCELCVCVCRGGRFWAASLTLCLQDTDGPPPPTGLLLPAGPHLPVPTLAAGRGNLLFGLQEYEKEEGPGQGGCFSQCLSLLGLSLLGRKLERWFLGVSRSRLSKPPVLHSCDPANSGCMSV